MLKRIKNYLKNLVTAQLVENVVLARPTTYPRGHNFASMVLNMEQQAAAQLFSCKLKKPVSCTLGFSVSTLSTLFVDAESSPAWKLEARRIHQAEPLFATKIVCQLMILFIATS